jgi:hypothetical protein
VHTDAARRERLAAVRSQATGAELRLGWLDIEPMMAAPGGGRNDEYRTISASGQV